ncbi:MAG: hypothetical protein ACE1Y7_02465, partial [Lysobacteraceae bacterium]
CEPGEVEGGLDDEERAAVIAFLDSLGRREFDADGENGVLVDDFTNMFLCSMIDVPITPDHECAVHDIDQNGIIDGSDFESFLLAFDGELFDCNCNGTNDLADIFFGQSSDGDGDGVPDECPPGDPPVCGQARTLVIKQGACPAPVNPNGNGVVPMVLVGDVDFAADTVEACLAKQPLSALRLAHRLQRAQFSTAYAAGIAVGIAQFTLGCVGCRS